MQCKPGRSDKTGYYVGLSKVLTFNKKLHSWNTSAKYRKIVLHIRYVT